MFHSAYLVLVPLVLAGLELIPHDAYEVFLTAQVFGQNQDSLSFDIEAVQTDFSASSSDQSQLFNFFRSEIERCQNQITTLRYVMT